MFADYGQVVLHDVGAPFESRDDDELAAFWCQPSETYQGQSVRWDGRAVSIAMQKTFVDVQLHRAPLAETDAVFEMHLSGGGVAFSEILNFPGDPDFTLALQPGVYRVSYQVLIGLVPDVRDTFEAVEQTLHIYFAKLD